MNKCPKTYTGKHYFCKGKYLSQEEIPTVYVTMMCHFCGIIDDRPEKKVKKKLVGYYKTHSNGKFGKAAKIKEDK